MKLMEQPERFTKIRFVENYTISLDEVYSFINLKCTKREAQKFIRGSIHASIGIGQQFYYEQGLCQYENFEQEAAAGLVAEGLAEYNEKGMEEVACYDR